MMYHLSFGNCLAFAMSLNKGQWQNLEVAGVDTVLYVL
jgi:hypothetical protein